MCVILATDSFQLWREQAIPGPERQGRQIRPEPRGCRHRDLQGRADRRKLPHSCRGCLSNFDAYALTYLEEAQRKGLEIKGVYIVDIKNCQFGDGWVTGDRIGKAFK